MHDEGIKKLYYSIGEVSALTGLEQHVLRYWETEFEQLSPRKNRAGRRIYTEEDIATVRRVQALLKDEKYTIEGAKRVLERGEENGEKTDSESLVELRAFLQSLLQQLDDLDQI